MIFADSLSLPIDSWVQYGCFGLLACIVAWALLKGIPDMLRSFQTALKEVTEIFREEQANCRQERVTRDEWIAREFAANRESRAKFSDAIQLLERLHQAKGE